VDPIRLGRRYQHVLINVWDLAGDEKFRGLDTGYYVATDIVMVCFDLTSEVTLRHCEAWIEKARGANLGDKHFILIGLKSDTHEIQVRTRDVKIQYPNLPYFEISGKTKAGVSTLTSYLKDHFDSNAPPQAKL
jgi:GTPase SAR1 family protein